MDARTRDLIRQSWPNQAAFTLFLAAILFVPAGSLAYWQGWLFLLTFIGSTVVLGLYFVRHDPALIERRMRAGPAAEQEPRQKIIVGLLLAGLFLMVLIPALDHRWQWSAVPPWLAILANAGIAASFVVFFAVMKQNSYAASTIRVEVGQPVIASGLYGIVRHPMYSGALFMMCCMPLALGSYWGLLLLIPTSFALAWRLLDEERYLSQHLLGYADYCCKVGYRLIPRLW